MLQKKRNQRMNLCVNEPCRLGSSGSIQPQACERRNRVVPPIPPRSPTSIRILTFRRREAIFRRPLDLCAAKLVDTLLMKLQK